MSILSHFWALLDLNGVLLGPLEVLLWPLKWLKHIILTQHTQAHCVKVFYYDLRLKSQQLYHDMAIFNYLPPSPNIDDDNL